MSQSSSPATSNEGRTRENTNCGLTGMYPCKFPDCPCQPRTPSSAVRRVTHPAPGVCPCPQCTPYEGSCKECGLDLSKVATLDCRHPQCPAYSSNARFRAEMTPSSEPVAWRFNAYGYWEYRDYPPAGLGSHAKLEALYTSPPSAIQESDVEFLRATLGDILTYAHKTDTVARWAREALERTDHSEARADSRGVDK